MGWDPYECGVCSEWIVYDDEDQGYCHRCRRTICGDCCEKVFAGYKREKCNDTGDTEGFHGCGCCDGKIEVAIRTRGYDTKKYEKDCDKRYTDSPLAEAMLSWEDWERGYGV